MKKYLSKWLLTIAFLLPCLLTMVYATGPTTIASGYCGGEGDGTNLTWALYTDGELTIDGVGNMKDYYGRSSGGSNGTTAPWDSYRSNITTVTVGNNVTTVGNWTFTFCSNLISVNIPDSVTSIGNYAFKACSNLSQVIIPDNVTTIGHDAFIDCTGLTDLTIGNSVITIGYNAFDTCNSLLSVYIPDSVTSIGMAAFLNCTSLTSVTIGDGVTSIGDGAFYNCSSLTEIKFSGNAPISVDASTFSGCNNLTIYYQQGATGWTASEHFNAGENTWLGRPLVMLKIILPPHPITDTGRSISLQDQIYINQYVTVEGLDGIDVASKGGLLIWNSPVAEERAVFGSADTTQTGLIAHGNEYTQRTPGIAAKEYADEIYLRVYIEVADGEYIYGPLVEYSVQDYCEHKIATDGYSTELKQTCAALLHYGAMAQRYFKYNTVDLANANILEVYPAPAWMTED